MKQVFKSIITTLIVLIISSILCFSQEDEYSESAGQHTLYVELFGTSMRANVNYDYSVKMEENQKFSAAIGAMFYPGRDILAFSPQVNWLFGIKHHLEMGVGATFQFTGFTVKNYNYEYFFPLRLGYRYQKSEGGFFWKIAWTPLYLPDELFFPFWGGLSFGYTLK